MKGGQYGSDDFAAGGGKLIAMGSGDFSDQAVGSQQAQPVDDAPPAPDGRGVAGGPRAGAVRTRGRNCGAT